MESFFLSLNRFALPILAVMIAGVSLGWLMRQKGGPPPKAWLLNTLNHDRLPLSRWENSVGRHPRCDVVLGYGAVSRFHAVIARRKTGWVLADTGSQGGTFRNKTRVERKTGLEHGDSLIFGSMEFIFCDEESERLQLRRQEEMFRRQREEL
ncbi:MAG: FHA domain-containing protein [Oscillospiraceae bacterium]|nr:FHA domain-containing protein [Oscillospiraceae bacterium]